MKKLYVVAAALATLTCFADPIAKDDFKYNINRWQKYGFQSAGGQISHDEEQGRTAPGAIKFEGTKKSLFCGLFYLAKFDRTKKYTASIWVKALKVQPGAYARLVGYPQNKQYKFAKGGVMAKMDLDSKNLADGEWHQLSVTVDPTPVQEEFSHWLFSIGFSGNGQVLFDDFQIEEAQ